MDGVGLSAMSMVVVGANVLGSGMAIPQAIRLVRHRRVEGVSTVWVAMSIMVNTWWVLYGLGTGEWAIVPVAVISVAAYGAVAAGLARFAPPGSIGGLGAPLLAAAAVGSVPLLALLAGGWPASGVALGTIYGIQLSPAVISAYRSPDPAGVSGATWAIAWSEAFLWAIYGVVRTDLGLATFGFTGLTASSAILLRLLHHRGRRIAARPARSRSRDPAAIR